MSMTSIILQTAINDDTREIAVDRAEEATRFRCTDISRYDVMEECCIPAWHGERTTISTPVIQGVNVVLPITL